MKLQCTFLIMNFTDILFDADEKNHSKNCACNFFTSIEKSSFLKLKLVSASFKKILVEDLRSNSLLLRLMRDIIFGMLEEEIFHSSIQVFIQICGEIVKPCIFEKNLIYFLSQKKCIYK